MASTSNILLTEITTCATSSTTPEHLYQQLMQLDAQTDGEVSEVLTGEEFPTPELALAAEIFMHYQRSQEKYQRFRQGWRDGSSGQFGLILDVTRDHVTGDPRFSVGNMWPRIPKHCDSLGCNFSNFFSKRFRRRLKKALAPAVA